MNRLYRIDYINFLRSTAIVLLLASFTSGVQAEDSIGKKVYAAKDTLTPKKDDNLDAQRCIKGLVWTPSGFDVTCIEEKGVNYDKIVRFASPIPSGDELNDLVAMEWYAARDENGMIIKAPAMLIVHESGSGMIVGRLFAQSLQSKGIHTFLIHLPHYGKRRRGAKRPEITHLVPTIRQAVADVRRGRDAIAAIPEVDKQHIGVQGTSLGGFVVATSASLDSGFDSVFVMLAGGNIHDVINSGQKDAAKVRELLTAAGYTDEKLKSLTSRIEPMRVAHRLNPNTTWLFSGEHDTVVPIENGIALAKAAQLDEQHHVRVLGNHYTAIAHFPAILDQMVKSINSLTDATSSSAAE